VKDNLMFKNMPGEELEKLSQENTVNSSAQSLSESEFIAPQENTPDENSFVSEQRPDNDTKNTGLSQETSQSGQNTQENLPSVSTTGNSQKNNSLPNNATGASPRNGYPHPQNSDANVNILRSNTLRNKFKNNSQQNGGSNEKTQNGYPYPQNTDPNINPPRTNTLRNKYKNNAQSNDKPQNGYQYPQNTDPNVNPPRTNTLRNKFKNDAPPSGYPNGRPQNGYPYPQNTDPNINLPRTNTLRNKFRNDAPPSGYPNGRPNNGYPYHQNPDPRFYYQGTNSFNNGYPNAYRPNNFYSPYPQNGYYGAPYTPKNINGDYYQPHYYSGGYTPAYPPYAPPRNLNNGFPNANANPYNQTFPPAPQPFFNEPNQKELERLELSKDCSKVGSATIAIFIVMFVVAIIIEIIAVMCGVSHDLPDMANDPYAGFTPMGYYMYTGLTSLLSIFLPSLILMKNSGRKISDLVPFKPIEGKKFAAIVMCGMSLCMVAQLMASLIQINFNQFGIDIYKGLQTATATGFYDVLMSIICTAVIPALVEEFAYRGFVAGLLKKHDEMLAVFGSAFLFGMLHGNFAQIPFAFVVGLILAYVRVKTDSMLPSILIHFGNNFYAVIITELDEILPDPISTITDIAIILVLVAVGFVCTNYLVKNHKDFFKLNKEKSLLTYKEKLSTFLKAGTVKVSFAILTIMSFVILFSV